MVTMGDLAAKDQILDLLLRSEKEEVFTMTSQDGAAFLEVLKRLCEDHNRQQAIQFLYKCKALPEGLDASNADLSKLLLPNGEIKEWMFKAVEAGNKDGLVVWSALVKVLGPTLHQQGVGTTLLNSLLQVVERAFKHHGNDIRKYAYQSWMALMDNFALDPAVLTSSKRIKLIVRPLIGSISNRNEEQVKIKFQTWWHYIGLLGLGIHKQVEAVVLPFLKFCYSSSVVTTAGQAQSPAKKYDSLRALCLEATAILVCGLNEVKAIHLDISAIANSLSEGVMKASHFMKNYSAILQCITDIFETLQIQKKSEYENFTAILKTIGKLAEELAFSSEKSSVDAIAAIGQYVDLTLYLMRVLPRSDEGHALIISLLQHVAKLPTDVISVSSQLEKNVKKESPAHAMIKFLFAQSLMSYIFPDNAASAKKDKFFSLLYRFLTAACLQRPGKLMVLEETLRMLGERLHKNIPPEAREVVGCNIWKTCADMYVSYVDKFNEINQSAKNAVEFTFPASTALLLFPLQFCLTSPSKLFWKQWIEVLNRFNEKAPLMYSYKTLHVEEIVAEEALKIIKNKESKNLKLQEWMSLSSIISRQLLSSIPFQSLSQESQGVVCGETESNPLGRLHKIIELLVQLIQLLPQFNDKATALALLQQLTQVLTQITSQAIQGPMFRLIGPAFNQLFDHSMLEKLGTKFEAQVKNIHDIVVNRFQSQYDGPFDKNLVMDLKVFISASLSHRNNEVKNKTRQMWELTFGPTLARRETPEGIWSLLNLNMPPSSSSQESQSGTGNTPEFAVPVTFGHIFDKHKQSLEKAEETISTQKTNLLSSTSTKKKPKTAKLSIDEENSQDFVKILSPASKKRILTEHQKEVLRQRNDDIPALYSELSRDDSVSLATVFQSQNSMCSETDSQMAVDATSSTSCPKTNMEVSPVTATPQENVLVVSISDKVTKSSDAGESTDTDASQDESVVDLTNEGETRRTRRKGRKPKKLTEAEQGKLKHKPRRRRSASQNEENSEIASSEVEVLSSQPLSNDDSQPKKRRGRPPRNATTTAKNATKPTLNSLDIGSSSKKRKRSASPAVTSSPKEDGHHTAEANVAKSSKEASVSSLSAQLTLETKVHIQPLSSEQMTLSTNSPVKIIKEVPLILEPVQNCKAAKRHNFDQDNEIIESSQTQEESSANKSAARKRRRHSFAALSKTEKPFLENVLDGSEPTEKRPVRKAALKHSISGTTNGEAIQENSKPGKENEGPLPLMNYHGAKQKTSKTNKYGESPLHVAIKKGDLDKVKSFLSVGADVNVKDHAGWTPLHEAAAHVGSNAKEIMELLISNGADVNAAANNGATPLHDAVAFMSQDCVQYLIEHGADPHIKNNDGKTAVSLAPEHMLSLFRIVVKLPSPQALAKKSVSEARAVSQPNVEEPEKDTGEEVEDCLNDSTNSVLATPLDASNDGDLEEVSDITDREAVAETLSLDSQNSEVTEETTKQPLEEQETSLNKNVPEESTSSLIKPPLPVFKNNKAKVLTSVFNSRGARLLEMSKAKAESPTSSACAAGSSASSPNPMLMSPRPELPKKSIDSLGVSTPTQSGNQPWQKFVPSPCDASPSAGILKRSASIDTSQSDDPANDEAKKTEAPPVKRRRVQFTDPPVSDQVVIPRCPSGKATRQRLQETRFNREMFLGPIAKDLSKTQFDQGDTNNSSEENDSSGLYEPTPPSTGISPNCIYPSLVDCDEPVSSILNNLTTRTWHKAAERSLSDNGIETIGDLCKLTAVKANVIKSLKPPSNLFTIREALRKFEKTRYKRDKEKEKRTTSEPSGELDDEIGASEQKEQSPTAAPVIDNECTPEEEEEAMKEIYERPSPSPTESIEHAESVAKEECQTKLESIEDQPRESTNPGNERPKEVFETAVQAAPSVTTSGTMTNEHVTADFGQQKEVANVDVGVATAQAQLANAHCQTSDRDRATILQEMMAAMETFTMAELSEILAKAADLFKKNVTSNLP